MDSNETWVEKSIEKIYKHPLFEKLPKAAYYDVAVLGKLLVLLTAEAVLVIAFTPPTPPPPSPIP